MGSRKQGRKTDTKKEVFIQTKGNKTMHQATVFPMKFKQSPNLRVRSDWRRGSLHSLLTVGSRRLKAGATGVVTRWKANSKPWIRSLAQDSHLTCLPCFHLQLCSLHWTEWKGRWKNSWAEILGRIKQSRTQSFTEKLNRLTPNYCSSHTRRSSKAQHLLVPSILL